MRRVMIIGAGCEVRNLAALMALGSMPVVRLAIDGAKQAELDAQIARLGLEAIKTAEKFRELAVAMPPGTEVLTLAAPPAPKFGGDRPYLKKKKGRP